VSPDDDIDETEHDDPLARELEENARGSALLGALERTNATLASAVSSITSERRVDLTGLPPAAAALLLVSARKAGREPFVVVVPDLDAARALANDLAFFTGRADDADDADTADEERRILVFPSPDVSPYADVAPDRRASMERLSTLFHLAHELPLDFVVVPAPALVRRVPPRDALVRRSMVVRTEEELDRDKLVRTLAEGGYLRVPMVEDPGTFSVRGSLIDIYPPNARFPARIELDDYLVLSIKHFDPEDQKTISTTKEIALHPVREALLGLSEIALARTKVRDLCDELEIPTRQAKQLIEDLESGRMVLGIEGLLPAFYEGLATLADYLPEGHRVAIVDPTAVGKGIEEELASAEADHAAKAAQKGPCFPVHELYADASEMVKRVLEGKVVLVHRLAVAGAGGEDESAFSALDSVDPERVLSLGAEDHTLLVATLAAQRAGKGKDDALSPLAERLREWIDAGFRVVIAARTRTQAERLGTLLRGYDLKIAGKPAPFSPASLETRPPRAVEIVIGAVATGFVLAQAALALVTEEEIFGTRAHRKKEKKRKAGKGADAFLEDLRQLAVGDYVVHSEHGIGRYLGLEKKALGQTQVRGDARCTERLGRGARRRVRGRRQALSAGHAAHQIQKFTRAAKAQPKRRSAGRVRPSARPRRRSSAPSGDGRRAPAPLRRARAHPGSALPPSGDARIGVRGDVPLRGDPRSGRGPSTRCSGISKRPPDGPPRLRRRGLRQDRGGHPRGLPRRDRRAPGGACSAPPRCSPSSTTAPSSRPLAAYPLEVEVLSRFVTAKKQRDIIKRLKEGKVDVVVGTHRLLSKDVHFKDLGPPRGGRRAALRRHAQGAHQAAARAGRRAHAQRHAHPAHAPDGRGRPARSLAHHHRRPWIAARCVRS
jgi:transcription-repair coupling factor (superfamily II helicase)